jgi:hypothetical protein
MVASKHELFSSFSGGQFEPVYSGQFEPVSTGQLKSDGGGQFHRILQIPITHTSSVCSLLPFHSRNF